jgi:hypothetical protein
MDVTEVKRNKKGQPKLPRCLASKLQQFNQKVIVSLQDPGKYFIKVDTDVPHFHSVTTLLLIVGTKITSPVMVPRP